MQTGTHHRLQFTDAARLGFSIEAVSNYGNPGSAVDFQFTATAGKPDTI
jgi:hypothetical protein